MLQTSAWGIIGASVQGVRMDNVLKDSDLLSLLTTIRSSVTIVPNTKSTYFEHVVHLPAGIITIEHLQSSDVQIDSVKNAMTPLGELRHELTLTLHLYKSEFITGTLDENRHVLFNVVEDLDRILVFESSHSVFLSVNITNDLVSLTTKAPYTIEQAFEMFRTQTTQDLPDLNL